jgi:hypothetical protein
MQTIKYILCEEQLGNVIIDNIAVFISISQLNICQRSVSATSIQNSACLKAYQMKMCCIEVGKK